MDHQGQEQHAKTDVAVAAEVAPSHSRRKLEYERLFGVDEDAYEQPTTTRRELWSYYLYYNGKTPSCRTPFHSNRTDITNIGDNGVGPGSYSQAL